MKRIKAYAGGRPRQNDDLVTLQDGIATSSGALFQGRGAFVLRGCAPSGLSLGAGLVYINSKITAYAGGAVTSFPCYMIEGTPIPGSERMYEDGVTRATAETSTVEIVYSVPSSGEFIAFTADGGRSFFDTVTSDVVITRGNQSVQGTKNFVSKIISAGMNVVDEILAIKSDGWVTSARIAAGAVITDKLADGGVTNPKLSDGAVSNAKIADGGVTTSKIADLSVTGAKIGSNAISTAKIGDGQVTLAKLAPDAQGLFSGNAAVDQFSIDFRSSAVLSSKTYSYLAYNLANNASRLKPLVKLAFYAARDSGGTDEVQVELYRSTNSSFTSPTLVARRYFKLDIGSWQYCPVEVVDESAAAGMNYYRLVCTNVAGTANYFSDAFETLAYSVGVS